MTKISLAIHGGAGTIRKSAMTPEFEREYRSGIENALQKGWEILEKGGSSLDAVEAAVVSLEDFHLFNAGRGSVFTHEGKNELDASIMDGKILKAGAVAFVKNIKNPIKLARLVMEKTEHVLLAGDGANQFAMQMGVETADDAYFFTEHRWRQFSKAREKGIVQLDHTDLSVTSAVAGGLTQPPTGSSADENPCRDDSRESVASAKTGASKQHKTTRNEKVETRRVGSVPDTKPLGTVGAVACDRFGNLAAATSTGGMTNKKFGRVGDTPLVGSGTYADNATCAVSCTGHGEFFMLGVTAYDVAARMKYKDLTLAKAANEAIEYLTRLGGEGGFIAVDAKGNVTLPFNSEGMYRGFITPEREPRVDIYG